MAHKLNIANNKISFVSKKEKAWHGLGTIVDALTSQDAIILGGLDFEVEKRTLFVEGKNVSFDSAKNHSLILRAKTDENNIVDINGIKNNYYTANIINDKFATVRTDSNLPLGIVGNQYHVIQNKEAFDFIDSIIGKGVADYETAGCLGNGEIIFITCKIRQEMIINKDLINNYLLITMAHDGSASITVMFTPIRVVCNNTLSLALQGTRNKVIIRHTKNAKNKLEQAKTVLGIIDQQTLLYEEVFGNLYKINISDEDAYDLLEKSLGLIRDEKNNLSTRAENIKNQAINYYHTGLGQEEIVGTGYGVFNAITGYFQNIKNYTNDETKFKSTFLNNDALVRQKTYQLITEKGNYG